ncbi:MAG: hypothetical protein HQK96_11905 [Nitrospirae bacterium]|nr:hypothetical protein [Nitrospirota bacterium]
MTEKETGMTEKETGMTEKETGMTDLGVHVFCLVCHSRESGNPEEDIDGVLFSYAFALIARAMPHYFL